MHFYFLATKFTACTIVGNDKNLSCHFLSNENSSLSSFKTVVSIGLAEGIKPMNGCVTSNIMLQTIWLIDKFVANNENIMYFPIGWPKYLKQHPKASQEPCFIVSSCDRMLFAIISEENISIWYCKVCTLWTFHF